MVKVVLFDADGVLIRGEMFSVRLEKDYGISTDTTRPFFTGVFKDCIIGNADLKEVLRPHLKEWGWKGTVDEFLNYWFTSEHHIDDELIQYIQHLRSKRVRCYLATNQEKYRIQYMLKEMGFEKSFDKIFASSRLGYGKPSLEFFAKVMAELENVNKDEVLFWDDMRENIVAAKEFGINAELYTNFVDFKNKMLEAYDLDATN